MAKEQNKARKKSKRRGQRRFVIPPYLKIVLAGVGVGILLASGGFAFAATQERHDSFCASCHTQPESTFYSRSIDAQPVDLASAHTSKSVGCIDCHSGSGVTGRVSAELLGAHNALAFYTGTDVQPAKLTRPVGDNNCVKCHANVLTRQEFDNHFHFFLPNWRAVDANAADCVTCHGGHSTDGTGDNMFLNVPHTQDVCQACHNVLRE